jgi:hypothetical protein
LLGMALKPASGEKRREGAENERDQKYRNAGGPAHSYGLIFTAETRKRFRLTPRTPKLSLRHRLLIRSLSADYIA